MLKNIPVELSGHRVRVEEAPTMKMYEDEDTKVQTVAKDFHGAPLYVVSVFLKPLPGPDGRTGKGAEIKVTLETDPGDEFSVGDVVELINPRVSHWERTSKGRTTSGLSWKATGIKPVGAAQVASAA
ncbi:YdcP family protein [Actinokineospora globicatena]|uniref:YdcP family protein n=1 Tax=Actinokineospora globicatena TaxID=103729 RepID=UPI0020A2C881|nr:YdcP family protein [Actinokineospora globicatena]MCP2306098.1 hypothetical protein [Actinokineospora globicatena]GLW80028.1 hypothetical protein Aglo01_45090 [Actinokineospora globicatena]GLW86857.1 hypothetical protein Aglo02_44960 [Actinokineospora globicatena]